MPPLAIAGTAAAAIVLAWIALTGRRPSLAGARSALEGGAGAGDEGEIGAPSPAEEAWRRHELEGARGAELPSDGGWANGGWYDDGGDVNGHGAPEAATFWAVTTSSPIRGRGPVSSALESFGGHSTGYGEGSKAALGDRPLPSAASTPTRLAPPQLAPPSARVAPPSTFLAQ